MKTLSAYKVTWAILIPVSGKCTKKDLKIINKVSYSAYMNFSNEIIFHSSDLSAAIKKIENIKGLGKKYEVVFITDKQFGNIDAFNSFRLVATKKQLQERFFI